MFTFDVFWGNWVLVSLGTKVQPQIILEPDYLPDYLLISYDYVLNALFVENDKEEIKQAYISKHNSYRENKVILLIILVREKVKLFSSKKY